MSDGQEPHEIQIGSADPGHAEGEIQLPGQEDQEGQEGQQEQEQRQTVVCESWGMLCPMIAACAAQALPNVEHDPKTYVAFKNLIQLLGYINARAGWMEL